MAWYRKHHSCPCGEEWWDEWDSLCTDRCPKCETEVPPDRHDVVEADDEDS